MLDSDWVAFPVLSADASVFGAGGLRAHRSLWRERSLTTWGVEEHINMFTVASFRGIAPQQLKPKGVTEGSEIQVRWKARFAPGDGKIVTTSQRRLDYFLDSDPGKIRHFRLGADEHTVLGADDHFRSNQVLAGQIAPLSANSLHCPGNCNTAKLEQMLGSRERTVRFTGCKLAKLARDVSLADRIRELAEDAEEDTYVRMEAKSYLCEVASESANEQFAAILLKDPDDQMRLEAAVALAETRAQTSFELLRKVLVDPGQPLFLRSACAWGIGCHGTQEAAETLVQAFSDLSSEIREEALTALRALGSVGFEPLLNGLDGSSADVAAGAAEALRRIDGAPVKAIAALAAQATSTWPTWTLAHLPGADAAPFVAALRERRPEIHYAVSVLRTFIESWIAEDWVLRPTP